MLTLQALTCFEGNYDKTVGLFGAVRRRLSNSTVTEWAPMKAVKQQTTLLQWLIISISLLILL